MIYVDTSALLKLVVAETESAAVDEYLADRDLVSSALLMVEAHRGVLRREPGRLPQVGLTLERVTTIAMSAAVIESASRLPDPRLRSLDAIHLATALLIRSDVEAVLTYDERLGEAARSHGLVVSAPSG